MPTYAPITEVEELDELRREIDVRLAELYDQAFEAKNIKITIPAANHEGPSTVRLTVQEVLAPLLGNASATSTTPVLDAGDILGGEEWTDLTDGGDTTLHIHEIYAEHAATEEITGAWDFSTMPVFSAGLKVTGITYPTAGVGPEMGWVDASHGRIICYDRDGAAYKPFHVIAEPCIVFNGATQIAEFKATSLDITKHVYLTGANQHLYLSGGGDVIMYADGLVGIPGHGQFLFATAAPKVSLNVGMTIGGDLAMAGHSITGLSTTGHVEGTATEYLSFDAAGYVDLHWADDDKGLRFYSGANLLGSIARLGGAATQPTFMRINATQQLHLYVGANRKVRLLTTVMELDDGIDLKLGADNQKLHWGTGDDVEAYFTGSYFVIDPNPVTAAAEVYIGATGEDTIRAGRYNVADDGTYIYQRADGYLSLIGDTAIELGDQTSGNYSCVEADGTIVSYGTATTFDDMYIGFSSARVPAANAPNWESFIGNLNAYTFTVNDYLELDPIELEHAYREDSNFELHIHWATNGTEGGAAYVKWEIEYTISNSDLAGGVGDTFPATTVVSAETEIPAATADLANMYTSIATVTGTNFNIGAILKMRVRRIASAGDAPAANPFGLMVGVHIEKDTKGSRTLTAK